jgi:hypothetical protein
MEEQETREHRNVNGSIYGSNGQIVLATISG